MKFRNRLLFAFLVVIFLPITLISLVAFGFTIYQTRILKDTYGNEVDFNLIGTSANVIATVSGRYAEMVRNDMEKDPYHFTDVAFLEDYNQKLLRKNTFLIVLKDGQTLFCGSGVTDDFLEVLQSETYKSELLYDKKNALFYTYLPVEETDDVEDMVVVVTRGDTALPEFRRMTMEFAAGVILILVLTAVALVYWIYRSIIVPIMHLRKAMQQVRDGNYDYVLAVDDSEFGPLCADFNQMRMRLKELAEQQMKNDAENKELISNISHDLKTPITAIKGYVEGLMDGVADTPERHERYIKTIYNKAIDMDHLIDELTFYSKVDTNRIPYRFSRVNVVAFFRDCAEETGLDVTSRGMEMRFENGISINTFIMADPEQMRRVVNNIIANSVKYMDKEQGVIKVSLREDERRVYISVEDNGRGISESALPHIFDRFYRGDSARNQSKPGSGIGLSVVRKIVEDHGGNVYATSKEGIGTKITIELQKIEEETYEEDSDY